MSLGVELAAAGREIIAAGMRLVQAGLVARSWGNISLRVDARRFLVTPSGRLYTDLTENQLVTVDIHRGTYEGTVKPSSESGLHARIYQQRADVCAIIHTHQPQASVLAAAHCDLSVDTEDLRQILGASVNCAPYALPSTRKLVEATSRALGQRKAVLMANHGVLCVGDGLAQAFEVAYALEEASAHYISKCFRRTVGSSDRDVRGAMQHAYLERLRPDRSMDASGPVGATVQIVQSRRLDERIMLLDPGATRADIMQPREDCGEITLHAALYRFFPKINHIVTACSPSILTVAESGAARMRPLLDDFTQIIGTTVRILDLSSYGYPQTVMDAVRHAARGRNAVMVRGIGALCFAHNFDEAYAASLVLDKNCRALVEASFLGGGRNINAFEAMLMRYVYLKKYSKIAASSLPGK